MFIYCRSLLLLLAYILPDNTEESEHAQSDQASQSCDLQLTALLLRNKRKNGSARVCASACVCVWLHKPVSNHWQSCFDIRRLKCFRCWFNFFFPKKKYTNIISSYLCCTVHHCMHPPNCKHCSSPKMAKMS